MKIAELTKKIINENINLYEAFNYSESEIEFRGDSKLDELIRYAKSNNISTIFYYYSNVTESALIDFSLITDNDFGVKTSYFMNEAKLYNKKVKDQLGNVLIATFFINDNGVFLEACISNDEVDCFDGADKFEELTKDYLEELEEERYMLELDRLEEAKQYEQEEKSRKLKQLYKELDKDEVFINLKNKEARTMRAMELASKIGLQETKSNMSSLIDIYMVKKRIK